MLDQTNKKLLVVSGCELARHGSTKSLTINEPGCVGKLHVDCWLQWLFKESVPKAGWKAAKLLMSEAFEVQRVVHVWQDL